MFPWKTRPTPNLGCLSWRSLTVRITQINMELKVGTNGGNTLNKNEKVRWPCMMEKGNRHMSEDPKVEKL